MMKTTSLKLSKALREAGAGQKASWGSWKWISRHRDGYNIVVPFGGDSWDDVNICRSFDCHELDEVLPDGTLLERVGPKYYQAWTGPENISVGQTPAEALGKLYLWCLQNGHCNE